MVQLRLRRFRRALGSALAILARLRVHEIRLGRTHLFVVPNPSPANAHFTLADQTQWYDRLEAALGREG